MGLFIFVFNLSCKWRLPYGTNGQRELLFQLNMLLLIYSFSMSSNNTNNFFLKPQYFKCKFSFIEHQIWGIWDIFLNFFHASWSIWYFVFYLCSMLLVLVSHQNFHLFKILSGILNKVDVCKLMAVVSFYCVMNFNFYCVMNSLYVRTYF